MTGDNHEAAQPLDILVNRLRDYLVHFSDLPLSAVPESLDQKAVREALHAIAGLMRRTEGLVSLTERDRLMFNVGYHIGRQEKGEEGAGGFFRKQRKTAGQQAGGSATADKNKDRARELRALVNADTSVDSRTKKLRRAADKMGEVREDRTLARWYEKAGTDKA